MWHRDLSKYKQYPGQDDITFGTGVLPAVMSEYGIAWTTPANQLIHNREDALAYAKILDSLIVFNRQRIANKKVKY